VAAVTRAVQTYTSDNVPRPNGELETAVDHENTEDGVNELDREPSDETVYDRQ